MNLINFLKFLKINNSYNVIIYGNKEVITSYNSKQKIKSFRYDLTIKTYIIYLEEEHLKDMNIVNNCKYCNSENFIIMEKGIHTGLFCSNCGNWIKWLSKKELIVYRSKGVKYI